MHLVSHQVQSNGSKGLQMALNYFKWLKQLAMSIVQHCSKGPHMVPNNPKLSTMIQNVGILSHNVQNDPKGEKMVRKSPKCKVVSMRSIWY